MPASEYPSVLQRTAVIVLIGVLMTLLGIVMATIAENRRADEWARGECARLFGDARTLADSAQVMLRTPGGPSYSARVCAEYAAQ